MKKGVYIGAMYTQNKDKRISELAVHERPREKLMTMGAGHLSDEELLAILLGSGHRNRGVERVASDLLSRLDRKREIHLRDLTEVSGIGPVKAIQLTAALEFARRRLAPERNRIAFPSDIIPLVHHYSDRTQECFLSISLNGAHEVLHIRVVSVGLVNRTIVHPREVFADPLKDRAAAVICCHNHPSGNTTPSPEDREVTRTLKEAGETLGIQLLDHIIFSSRGYFSFLEQGMF